MGKKTAKMIIRLKSDICIGSGYSYEGTVDNDVCYNENGIPYIPGRRIKGCLKEAAELIRIPTTDIENLFGTGGKRNLQKIFVGNAYPDGYENLNQELSMLRRSEKYKDDLTAQKILNRFTHIRANTSIESSTGVADENTLRFTRVINQYSTAGDFKEMEFVSDISFDCDEKTLEKIIRSLRHMGFSRNRGLGNVSCSLRDIEAVPDSESMPECSKNQDMQEMARLDYQIVNTQSLMMSAGNDSRSETYISGQNMLGALAGMYLEKKKDHTADKDSLFADLFLNGSVRYSNLYISEKKKDSGKMIPYVPAPLFLNELKKTKEIVNTAKPSNGSHYGKDGRLDAGNGNQPKKLKGKYVSIAGDSIRILEPETDIEFHHTSKKIYAPDSPEDGQLYAFTVLRQGQSFCGSIFGKKCHLEILEWLLKHADLRLGKSKTAQYGACAVSAMSINSTSRLITIEAGEEILAALESDGVFLIPGLGYTDRYDKVMNQIAKELLISWEMPEHPHSAMQTVTVSGYNTKWNLKKPSFPAIRAGSVFHYRLKESIKIEEESWVGQKNHEGFGKVRIYRCSQLPEEYEVINLSDGGAAFPQAEHCRGYLTDILYEGLEDTLNESVFEKPSIGISASTLGRVTLMLKESGGDFKDFMKRVNSISREKERKKIQAFIERHIGSVKKGSEAVDIEKMLSIKKQDTDGQDAGNERIKEMLGKLSELENWKGPIPESADGEGKRIEAMWGNFLLQIFHNEKYRMKKDAG